MNDSVILVIGFVAAIVTTSAFFPQAWKTVRSKRAGDYSWAYLGLFSACVSLWVVYGILKRDPAIIAANAITLALTLVIAGVKMRS